MKNNTKIHELTQTVDHALEALTHDLEQGRSVELLRYLAAIGRFHGYSFRNIALITAKRPDATRVAGFRAWKHLGRSVKKGEKGIPIVAPVPIKPDAADNQDPDSESIVRFRAAYVFDIAQTEGEAVPEPAQVSGDTGAFTLRLKALIASKGIDLVYARRLGGAEGLSSGGTIALLDGLAPPKEFSVLVHELAHELLHHGEGRKTLSKTVRETEAEAVAFIVSHAIGLETNTAASDYIQLYDGDLHTLESSLNTIRQTAGEILKAIGETPSPKQEESVPRSMGS